jgi:chemotaxis response regulator CheB
MECEKEHTGREAAGTSETGLKISPDEGRDPLQKRPCFVVGIGASAGGQAPLEHIFTTLPSD